jgi:chromate transporter
MVMPTNKRQTSDSVGISTAKLIQIFLKTGAHAFGGWSTTVILLEKELGNIKPAVPAVDLKSAAAYAVVLPGATQVAIVSNVGYQLRGAKGALIATVSYLFPAISLMMLFAFVYFGHLHQTDLLNHLDGLIATLSGIILANAYRIGSKHVAHPLMWLLVIIACLALLLLKIHALVILLVFGMSGLLLSLYRAKSS